MKDLREHYRRGLAAQIDALEIAMESMADNRADSVESIRRLAHRLHGSGATYGHPEISAAAALVERVSADEIEAPAASLLQVLRATGRVGLVEPARILIVEDDAMDIEILTSAFSDPRFGVRLARSTAEAERILTQEPVDLVVLDLVLPDRDGRSLLVRLRETPRTSTVPVFVLSARLTDQVEAECLALGAEQLFQKPVNPQILSAAVSSSIRRCAQLTRDSRRDPLTGLPNRAAFCEAFSRSSSLMDREGRPLTVAIVDLDRFKTINDVHGHATGDEVLCWAARLISHNIRRADYLARWGGEEFVALFPGADERGAVRAVENALETLTQSCFVGSAGRKIAVTFSAGVAQVDRGASVDDALSIADRFLYLAKQAGRCRVFASSSNIPIATTRILLAEDDTVIADVVTSKLGTEGLEVIHCSNGRDALASVEHWDVALGILDVNMPGMDGYDLLRRLRETPRFADRPVVMLTGRGSEEDIVKGFDCGADDYIVKPFSPGELQARVHRLLKRA